MSIPPQSRESNSDAGTLFVVATPIGNLDDLTPRARDTLSRVALIAAEDTRHTATLLRHFGIDTPSLSLHDHNEAVRAEQVVARLQAGDDVALVSDAGTPLVSDPGFRAVQAALEGDHRIEVVPGPTAVSSALALSGLSAASYTFLGFPPRKPGKLRNALKAQAELEHTLVLFESPHRTGALLTAALEVLGDRRAAVCIELTKMFEETARGWTSELAKRFSETDPRGEVTVVIAGNNPKFLRPADADVEAS